MHSKVVLLTNNSDVSNSLMVWLSNHEDVLTYSQRIDCDFVRAQDPDIIISYSYKYIISEDVLNICKRPILNLHCSLLPWNKGSDPNFWSFFEDTPKGVTIHNINAGVDEGDILLQKELTFKSTEETFRSSYDKLHDAMFELFTSNWNELKIGSIKAMPQIGNGSYHTKKDYTSITSTLPVDYDSLISDYLSEYSKIKRGEQ